MKTPLQQQCSFIPTFTSVQDLNISSTSAAQIVFDSVTAFCQYIAGPLAVYMSL